MANQFSVDVPNVYQALMAGEQGYEGARKTASENEMKAGRLKAVQALQSGGDIRSPLAELIGIGDTKGAEAISTFAHQQAQQGFQQQQLGQQAQQFGVTSAESSRHNKATEALSAETANKPMILPPGSGLVDRKGNVIREASGEGTLDAPTLDFMARQYMAGDTSVLTNLGRGAQGAQNVVALRKRVAELNQQGGQGGADQANRNAEFFGTKAGQRTLGTKQANIELAATEFEQVLPVVQKASQAVNRTNYPDLNRIIQAYETKTGDPNIVAFGGAVNTLVNLYSRAISPNGVSTVHDKEHAREILTKAYSQGQFDAAVGMMRQEISAALQSPEKVRDDMRKRFLGGQPGQTASPAVSTSSPAPPATTQTGVPWRIVQ